MNKIIGVFSLLGLLLFCSSVSAGELYQCWHDNSGCQTGGDNTPVCSADGDISGRAAAATQCIWSGAPYSAGTSCQLINKNGACTSASNDFTSHTCPGDETYNFDLQACEEPCPEGQEEIDGFCTNVCPVGASRDPVTFECTFPPVDCPEGQEDNNYLSGGEWFQECREVLPGTSPEDCKDVDGYITDAQGNEYQACADNANDCESTGGTFGMLNNEEVCLPPEFADDLPTCDITTLLVLDGQGGYACLPKEEVAPPDDPNEPGTPGYTGPGKTDPNDPTTTTGGETVIDTGEEGEKREGTEESNVQGGGSCGSRPKCTGDAVQCAILYQTWSQRCENSNLTEDVKGKKEGFWSEFDSGAVGVVDALGQTFIDAIGDSDSGIGGPAGLGGSVTSAMPSYGSCSDITFSWQGQTTSFTCAGTQRLRDVLTWLCALYTLLTVFRIAMQQTVK